MENMAKTEDGFQAEMMGTSHLSQETGSSSIERSGLF
jgi:hypothetical protein